MKVSIQWMGYYRKWCVINTGHQGLREEFESFQAAEEWAKQEGYEVIC